MELLKKRDFSLMFSDTFGFLKESGKHLLKNYLIINGSLFLIVLSLIMVFGSLMYMSSDMTMNSDNFENIFEENIIMIIPMIFIFMLLIFFIGGITQAFFPIYLNLYRERQENFDYKDIIEQIKQNLPKIIKSVFGLILVALMLIIPFMIICFLLAITIIGIPALLLVIAAFMLIISNTLYEYFFKIENRFFDSFSKSFKFLKVKFWHSVGCLALIVLITSAISQVIQLIFQFSLGISSFDFINDDIDITSFFAPIMIVSFIIMMIVSLIANLINYLNQGIIYYSLKEELENINEYTIIDEIGIE